MTRSATREEANAFLQHMALRFSATVLHKEAAIEMNLAAQVLDFARKFGLDLPDADTFLHRCATTVGNMVYIPDAFTPDQVIEVATHEFQHVHQFEHGGLKLSGGPGMWWLYLVASEARVQYEAEACRAGMEVVFWRTGQLPADLKALSFPLEEGYALTPGDLQLGRDLLEISATSIAAGVVSTAAGQTAIDWLRQNAPDLAL
jgi:hypothetical protein